MVKVKDTVAPVSSGDHVFIEDGAMKMKTVDGSFGMTIRQHYAAMAMQGILAAGPNENSDGKIQLGKLAFKSFEIADAMIEAGK